MVVLIPIAGTFIMGLVLGALCKNKFIAWLVAVAVIPGYVLLAEYVLPYAGGGASFWPIALVTVSAIGMDVGGLGVACGALIGDWREWW